MILSSNQVSLFWRLWGQACAAQGWTRASGLKATDIDAKRKEFLRGCGFKSLTLVDGGDGFNKVLNELRILINPDLQAAREADDQTIDQARRKRFVIREQILPCLALYEEHPEQYLTTVVEGQSRWWITDRPERSPTLEDFDEPLLKRVMMTLNARLHAKRKAARDTIHDMKTKAGVYCDCAACSKRRMAETITANDVPADMQPF